MPRNIFNLSMCTTILLVHLSSMTKNQAPLTYYDDRAQCQHLNYVALTQLADLFDCQIDVIHAGL